MTNNKTETTKSTSRAQRTGRAKWPSYRRAKHRRSKLGTVLLPFRTTKAHLRGCGGRQRGAGPGTPAVASVPAGPISAALRLALDAGFPSARAFLLLQWLSRHPASMAVWRIARRHIVNLALLVTAAIVTICYTEDELGDDRGTVIVPTLAWLLAMSVVILSNDELRQPVRDGLCRCRPAVVSCWEASVRIDLLHIPFQATWVSLGKIVGVFLAGLLYHFFLTVGNEAVHDPVGAIKVYAGVNLVAGGAATASAITEVVHGCACAVVGPSWMPSCPRRNLETTYMRYDDVTLINVTAPVGGKPARAPSENIGVITDILELYSTLGATSRPRPAARTKDTAKMWLQMNSDYAAKVGDMMLSERAVAVELRADIRARPGSEYLHIWPDGVTVFEAGLGNISRWILRVWLWDEPASTIKSRTKRLYLLLKQAEANREAILRLVSKQALRDLEKLWNGACKWSKSAETALTHLEKMLDKSGDQRANGERGTVVWYGNEFLSASELRNTAANMCRMIRFCLDDTAAAAKTTQLQSKWLKHAAEEIKQLQRRQNKRREPLTTSKEVQEREAILFGIAGHVAHWTGTT